MIFMFLIPAPCTSTRQAFICFNGGLSKEAKEDAVIFLVLMKCKVLHLEKGARKLLRETLHYIRTKNLTATYAKTKMFLIKHILKLLVINLPLKVTHLRKKTWRVNMHGARMTCNPLYY